jgi:hypothetical protein
MQLQSTRHLRKYLAVVIPISLTLTPNLANANQIAQGIIQLSITALAYPQGITSATCGLSLFASDPTTFLGFSNDVTVDAAVSNNVVTCNVTEPYYWSLTNLSGTIDITYSVTVLSGTVVTKTTTGSFDPIPASTTGTTPLIISTVF